MVLVAIPTFSKRDSSRSSCVGGLDHATAEIGLPVGRVGDQKNIDELTKAKGKDFRFVGLSLSGENLKEYVEQHHLNFPVYSGPKSDTIQSLGIGGTPQTIVISPAGLVLKNWSGAYREETQREIEDYFQVRLPGLISADH